MIKNNVQDFTSYEEKFNAIIDSLNKLTPAVNIIGGFSSFCPEIQFVRLDALEIKDYPNGISDNSIFIEFEIDLENNSISVHRTGHVWLSPSDRESDKYKYLAMKSMTAVHVDNGGKKFRKSRFKKISEANRKMNTYFCDVMSSLDKYTGGYPYKQGI